MNSCILPLIFLISFGITVTVGEETGCSLCPDSSTGDSPDTPIPLTNYTCLEYEDMTSQLTAEECPFSGNFDVSAYCRCPGTEPPPSLCEMCPGGSLVDPGKPIGIVESKTCFDVDEDLLRFYTDELACLVLRDMLLTDCECTATGSSAKTKGGKKQKKPRSPKDSKKKRPKIGDDSTDELEEPNVDSEDDYRSKKQNSSKQKGDIHKGPKLSKKEKRSKRKGGISKGPKLSDTKSRRRG